MRSAAETARFQTITRLALAGVALCAFAAATAAPASALTQPVATIAPQRPAAGHRNSEILEAFQGAALSVPVSTGTAPAGSGKPAGNGPSTAQSAPNAAVPAAPSAATPTTTPPATTPPAASPPATPLPGNAAPGNGALGNPAPGNAAPKPADETAAPMEIIRDLNALPAPVKEMRQKIMDAAASGDIQKLTPLFGTGQAQTQVMNGEFEDPIETLKNFSGDVDGQEILAILLDILSTGAAHFDTGTPDETYVWPYFTGKTLSTLTPPEKVELLRIVTAGDLAGMQENGNYNFFRLGITPDGRWKFLSGGD